MRFNASWLSTVVALYSRAMASAGMHTDNVAICIKRRRPLPVAASILIEHLASGLTVLGD